MALKTFALDPPEEFKQLSAEEQKILLAWCSRLEPIKTINTRYSSYGLKHQFNNSEKGFYITNGMFKGAMLESGFSYKPVSINSRNWFFNISVKSVREVVYENRLRVK